MLFKPVNQWLMLLVCLNKLDIATGEGKAMGVNLSLDFYVTQYYKPIVCDLTTILYSI